MELRHIGVIHSPFKTKDECPIQPSFASEAEGTVEVSAAYQPGLKNIEVFSHIYLLYSLDRAGEIEMVRSTFLDDEPHGIYASRHPCRPNSIGMSIVQLVENQGDTLLVKGIDVLDKTPLLDIKPYIPRFDMIESASDGWLADKKWHPKPANRE